MLHIFPLEQFAVQICVSHELWRVFVRSFVPLPRIGIMVKFITANKATTRGRQFQDTNKCKHMHHASAFSIEVLGFFFPFPATGGNQISPKDQCTQNPAVFLMRRNLTNEESVSVFSYHSFSHLFGHLSHRFIRVEPIALLLHEAPDLSFRGLCCICLIYICREFSMSRRAELTDGLADELTQRRCPFCTRPLPSSIPQTAAAWRWTLRCASSAK